MLVFFPFLFFLSSSTLGNLNAYNEVEKNAHKIVLILKSNIYKMTGWLHGHSSMSFVCYICILGSLLSVE